MKKGLSAFWGWLEKKTGVTCFEDIDYGMTPQMLMGYMIEYLFEKGFLIANIPFKVQTQTDINSLYGYLKKEIKKRK